MKHALRFGELQILFTSTFYLQGCKRVKSHIEQQSKLEAGRRISDLVAGGPAVC